MIIRNVLDQHAEEASFLGGLRLQAVHAPNYDLKHLQRLEERIEAHLDGLSIAGAAGLDVLFEQFSPHAEAELFATTVLAFRAGDNGSLAKLAAHLRQTTHGERAFTAAIGWLQWPEVQPWVERLLASAEPLFRRIGLAACGMHRHDPGPALLSALGNADSHVLARAARTAGELRRRDLMRDIRVHRLHADAAVRFWANWATAQMGDEEALGPLRLFAEHAGPFSLRALRVLLCWQARETSVTWLRGLMQSTAHRRLVIQAVGLFGDPFSVPWLIQHMQALPFARAAGEAFSLITGADLAELDLELRDYPDYDAGPTDDPGDPNVEMDPDTDLAWPDPLKVDAWWQANRTGFQAGTGYLLGKPFSEAQCLAVLRDGSQRQRIAAATLLARFIPTRPLFPTSAPAARQLNLL
ncbi:TIGR02270 family protein [Pseudomonas sp. LRF_L74]|uniref:TIGR02270 family protein n=1 Tax=Pseudomonas sp. LRF_L74 TaxID=3369422 RepID=UPI003F5F2D9E